MTQTAIQKEPKPVLIQHAPPTLVEEILEETNLRSGSGLLDLEFAADQAEQRVKALTVLRHAAIGATKPIHWLLFKNQQGMIFGRFNFAGAQRIGMVFGITVTPKGPVKITETHGKRKTAEIYGTAHSAVLRLTFDNIRAYRVEGEDFLGRPSEDTNYSGRDGKPGKTVVGVGDNDWIQSTQTALLSKGVRLLSGLVTVTPDELAEVWDMSVDDVIKQCAMGHGFSREERQSAGQTSGPSKLATEPQRKMLFAKANTRAKELPDAGVDGKAILYECIMQVCGQGKTEADVTMDDVNKLVPAITSWGNGDSGTLV